MERCLMQIMEYSKIIICLLLGTLFASSSSLNCMTDGSTEGCKPKIVDIGCLDVKCLRPASIITSPGMRANECMDTCISRGFYYTGLFNGTECWCANSPPCKGDSLADKCGVPCAGDITTMCGGRHSVDVFSHQYEHPAIGDWWFNGSNNILECSGTNSLNISVATAVDGYSLTGQWQLSVWGTDSLDSNAERYNEAALSLSLEDVPSGTGPNGQVLQTVPKTIRWGTDWGPPCDEFTFLCVQLFRLRDDFPTNETNPPPSCHEIGCQKNSNRRLDCKENQCYCVKAAVIYPSSNVTEDTKLSIIENVTITEDTVIEVLDEVILLTYDDFKADEVISTANVVERVVSLSSTDTEITRDVVEIIGKLMDSDPEELSAAQDKNQSSSRVMLALEHQLQVVDLTQNNGSFTSVQPNLAVQVQSTTPDVLREGITFVSKRSTVDDLLTEDDIGVYDPVDDAPIDANDLRASVNVKTQFEEVDDASVTSDIRIAFAVVREPTLFISAAGNSEKGWDGQRTGRRLPNTPVISVTIKGAGRRKVQTEVTSTFHPIHTSNSSVIIDDPVCVFWDFEDHSGTGDWSDYGCSLVENKTTISDHGNSTAITCTCNHTTNFAVIMNFHSPEPSLTFRKVSKFLSIIGCGLSIGSLIITLTVYLLSPKLRQKQPNQIFMNICLSLLCLYIAYIMVVIVNRRRDVESHDENPHEKEVEIWCLCVAALIQYFTLTSLLWMGVEGVNMYLLFVKVVNATIQGFMAKASLVAWGLPMVAVAITGGIARQNYVDRNLCFLAKMPKIGGLLCPIGVIIVANIIIFTTVVIRLGRTMRTSSVKKDSIIIRVKEGQQRLQKAVCIFLLLGLTWASGYLLLVGTAFNQIFQIVFIVLNSFQGFFIFVVYCLRQRVVRAELRRLCGCRESKKRRSISIASTSQREDTTKTRQTEMPSMTVASTHQDNEVGISDAEIAEDVPEHSEAGHFFLPEEAMESRPGTSGQQGKRRSKTSRDPAKKRSTVWLNFAEIRQRLEEVLSKGKSNRKQAEDLSSKCWAGDK